MARLKIPALVAALSLFVAACSETTSGVVRLDDGLAAGQRVRVLTGPFAQMLGQLERLDHRGRVRVLLDIMGGKVAAELDRSALSKA